MNLPAHLSVSLLRAQSGTSSLPSTVSFLLLQLQQSSSEKDKTKPSCEVQILGFDILSQTKITFFQCFIQKKKEAEHEAQASSSNTLTKVLMLDTVLCIY